MHTARVITVSDRSAAGTRPDTAGPIAVTMLREDGWDVAEPTVVPDGADSVEGALRAAIADGIRLVVTTGGTGVAPRDQTPEGTARVIVRDLPGIPEELRRSGTSDTPMSIVSRGLAGIAADGTLVVNLPGSPRAVASGIPIVLAVASHIVDQLGGSDHA